MSWFSSKKSELSWNHINSAEDLNVAISNSNEKAVLLFKHSTRCSISSMAKSRLEDKWVNDIKIQPYYLDLIAFRDVSNQIADRFNIIHQSPSSIPDLCDSMSITDEQISIAFSVAAGVWTLGAILVGPLIDR